MKKRDNTAPRNYYLNEKHELTPSIKPGGGGNAKYAPIQWSAKSATISNSLIQLKRDLDTSQDPLRGKRYFALALPEASVSKLSNSKKKAPDGIFEETTDFRTNHCKVLERIGLEQIEVSHDGGAVVHADNLKFDELIARTQFLPSAGTREQSRWATVNSFAEIPWGARVDAEWLFSLETGKPAEVIFELQPVLGRVDANQVLESLTELLRKSTISKLTNLGMDFSGRYWVRGIVEPELIKHIAETYYSIQSIHRPLRSRFLSTTIDRSESIRNSMSSSRAPLQTERLPCVAIVDTGVPSDHLYLAEYSRGRFMEQGANIHENSDHGSFVASRVVFGENESYDVVTTAKGKCSFYDVPVGDISMNRVNDKLVINALSGVVGAAPDVRVFNLSFGSHEALGELREVEKKERLLELQDLDNFIFANDVVVVVAAGNSRKGLIPSQPYPKHIDDPSWALGAWASGYNTLVCGSHVSKLSSDSIASQVGFPSPFTRIGFGINKAPVPTFSAPGGNCLEDYANGFGLGVYGINRMGDIEDRIGTSYSAPILARSAALAMDALNASCPTGSSASAVLVKAYLALFAQRTTDEKQVQELAKRTLGLGNTTHDRLVRPDPLHATIGWQGVIETSKDIVSVRLPIPRSWLKEARTPKLRLCVAHDSPVNQAAIGNWACRKVDATLRVNPDAQAATGTRTWHNSYPLFIREYPLEKIVSKIAPDSDFWILEFKYSEISPYPAGMIFDPRQRVAFCAELLDMDTQPSNPHTHIQSLPIASELNQLSYQNDLTTPVYVRSRI